MDYSDQLLDELTATCLTIFDHPRPVVAAVNGPALAGGTEFLLSTDLRIAAEHATFTLTEVRRGLIASGGSLVRLARQLPWAHAMEIALAAEDRRLAMRALGRITGTVRIDELLDVIFRDFCLGQ